MYFFISISSWAVSSNGNPSAVSTSHSMSPSPPQRGSGHAQFLGHGLRFLPVVGVVIAVCFLKVKMFKGAGGFEG